MNLRFLWAIARKEFHHILRDGQTLGIILSLPMVMMFLFGYALKSEIENAPIILVNPISSPATRALTQALEANTLLHVVAMVPQGNPQELLNTYRARAVLYLSSDYARTVQDGPVKAAVYLDGSDPATATTLSNAINAVLQSHLASQKQVRIPTLVQLDARYLYNPEQKSSLFFVPGLMATILAMISALLTSVTVTREKEVGTLQNLRISRLSPADIIVGKLLPYFVIASFTGVLILSVGYLAFGVVIKGSLAFLALASAAYLIANLGIGLLVSTVVAKQQHAMLLALGISMMPVIMLSGFVFPISSLPAFLQGLSHILPATWYLQIVRGIILKASDPTMLLKPFLVLCAMGIALLTVATTRFYKEK